MREMKDSGVVSIGMIPVEWKTIKLKFLFGDGNEGLKIGPFGSAMKGKTLESGEYKIYNQAHLINNDFSLNRHFVSEVQNNAGRISKRYNGFTFIKGRTQFKYSASAIFCICI